MPPLLPKAGAACERWWAPEMAARCNGCDCAAGAACDCAAGAACAVRVVCLSCHSSGEYCVRREGRPRWRDGCCGLATGDKTMLLPCCRRLMLKLTSSAV